MKRLSVVMAGNVWLRTVKVVACDARQQEENFMFLVTLELRGLAVLPLLLRIMIRIKKDQARINQAASISSERKFLCLTCSFHLHVIDVLFLLWYKRYLQLAACLVGRCTVS